MLVLELWEHWRSLVVTPIQQTQWLRQRSKQEKESMSLYFLLNT